MKWAYEQVTGSGEVNAHDLQERIQRAVQVHRLHDRRRTTRRGFQTRQDDYAGQADAAEHCDKAAKDARHHQSSTVAFQAPKRGKDLLSSCASGENYYYDAESADELTKAFKDIGEEAVKLVTRLTR
jgi:hypothetical protein